MARTVRRILFLTFAFGVLFQQIQCDGQVVRKDLLRQRRVGSKVKHSNETEDATGERTGSKENNSENIPTHTADETLLFHRAHPAEATGSNSTEIFPADVDMDIDARIVGGMRATCRYYPYFVAGFEGDVFTCGAALVAPNVAISAAHCSPMVDNVKIGICRKQDRGPRVEKCKVVRKVNCPKHGRGYPFERCDVSLFKLDCKSKASVVTINADPKFPVAGQAVTAVGMGAISEFGPMANRLREVDVKYITNAKCKQYYTRSQITPDMLCAVGQGWQKDACQGDSGGPLVVKGQDKENILIGTVSWGTGCARLNSPGVYYRTSFDIAWIKRTVRLLAGKLAARKLKFRMAT